MQTYAPGNGNSFAKVYINGIIRTGIQTEATGVSNENTIALYKNDVVTINIHNGGVVNGKVYIK